MHRNYPQTGLTLKTKRNRKGYIGEHFLEISKSTAYIAPENQGGDTGNYE
jgi:hypothetical protein